MHYGGRWARRADPASLRCTSAGGGSDTPTPGAPTRRVTENPRRCARRPERPTRPTPSGAQRRGAGPTRRPDTPPPCTTAGEVPDTPTPDTPTRRVAENPAVLHGGAGTPTRHPLGALSGAQRRERYSTRRHRTPPPGVSPESPAVVHARAGTPTRHTPSGAQRRESSPTRRPDTPPPVHNGGRNARHADTGHPHPACHRKSPPLCTAAQAHRPAAPSGAQRRDKSPARRHRTPPPGVSPEIPAAVHGGAGTPTRRPLRRTTAGGGVNTPTRHTPPCTTAGEIPDTPTPDTPTRRVTENPRRCARPRRWRARAVVARRGAGG